MSLSQTEKGREDKKIEEWKLNGGKGRRSRAKRSQRLNSEEIECSSNIEEDSEFAKIEGGTYPSVRFWILGACIDFLHLGFL